VAVSRQAARVAINRATDLGEDFTL
jgi:hypothetical protein